MKYIKKDLTSDDNIMKNIQKMIGDSRTIKIKMSNGKVMELEIDDKGLSATKKKELQNYVDTLEK